MSIIFLLFILLTFEKLAFVFTPPGRPPPFYPFGVFAMKRQMCGGSTPFDQTHKFARWNQIVSKAKIQFNKRFSWAVETWHYPSPMRRRVSTMSKRSLCIKENKSRAPRGRTIARIAASRGRSTSATPARASSTSDLVRRMRGEDDG